MLVRAYQHGIYPRSQALVGATRDLDRGRTTAAAVNSQFDRDLSEFGGAQQRAGLDYYSDGMLRWPDLFRPLTEACRGMTAGPLVRWFDTNSFFRSPVVTGDLGFDGALPVAFSPAGPLAGPRAATLPSPYVFSRIASHPGGPNDLMLSIAADLLRPIADLLVAAGVRLIHFQEPWLGCHGIDPADWAPFERSIALLTDGLGATAILHTYHGDAGDHAIRLAGLPVDAVGFDFTETDPSRLGRRWPIGIMAGCLDGRRSLTERAADLSKFVISLADRAQPAAIYLSSASDLSLLPEAVASRKVSVLGEAGREIKAALA